jgi:penicillin-binding protein 1A
VKNFLIAFAAVLALGAVGLAGLFLWAGDDLPTPSAFQQITPRASTRIYDSRGLFIDQLYQENRQVVSLDQISPRFLQAVVDIEDHRFRQHWGVDVFGVMRAVLRNVVRRDIVGQGASTLTQQLARNLFLTREKTFSRKLKELLLALRIERTFTKDEILEMYVNQIYFGDGAYGIQATSRKIYGRDCSSLTLSEAALLAGLPRNPWRYSPHRYPDAAKKRRAIVLRRMLDEGHITPAEMEKAAAAPLESGSGVPIGDTAPYLIEMTRRYLLDRYGAQQVFEGGLSVYTTLDLELQRHAAAATEEHMLVLEDKNKYRASQRRGGAEVAQGSTSVPYLQGAAVVLEASTGKVRALVGGRDYHDSSFNRAVQAKRQPGSAFKPFIYTAAIERGFRPTDMLLDAPTTFRLSDGQSWTVHNYDPDFAGPVTLRYALQRSINVPAARLLQQIGPRAAVECAESMGIKSPIPAYLSIALGTAEVTLWELTSSYSAFANQGIRAEPYFIEKVVDRDGNVLEQNHPVSEEALDPNTAYTMVGMLRAVVDEGTGAPARKEGFDRPAGGKTGTTDDFTDAWFVGFTPDVVCGVWVGFDVKRPIGHKMTGAVAALPIWTKIMIAAGRGKPVAEFPPPSGVTTVRICSESGLLASPNCPIVTNEPFRGQDLPTRYCYIHDGRYRPKADEEVDFRRIDERALRELEKRR